MLKEIAAVGSPPGAVAAAGVVGAIAAAVGIAGGLGEPLDAANEILELADADTTAYWSGDEGATWSTPIAVAEAVDDLADRLLRIEMGNLADVDAARCLAFGASASAHVVAQHNSMQPGVQKSGRTTLLAAAPSDASPLLNVSRAAGPYLWDSSGAVWFDATAGMWNVPLGHGASEPIAAWVSQVVQVAAVDPFVATTSICEALGERLVELTDMPRASVVLNSSGSDANETALRFALAAARDAAGPPTVWALPTSFHGSTAGVAVLSSFSAISGPLPEQARWPHIAPPSAWTTPGIAFVEPVSASRGAEALSAAEALAIADFQSRGGIIIADEIASGLGRAGWPLASRAVGLEPDVITLGKGLTNGVAPLSATIISERIAAAAAHRGLDFGHTYSNHPASAAAAFATLDALAALDLDEQASKLKLALSDAGVPAIGRGSMLAIRGTSQVSRAAIHEALTSAQLVVHLLSAVQQTSELILCPPLNLTDTELEDLASRTKRVCDRVGW